MIDAAASILIALLLWSDFVVRWLGVIVVYDGIIVHDLAQKWLGPIITLFGLFCATNAFMFTVVDRVEFSRLRKSKAQAQMWEIMAGGIIVLLTTSLWTLFLAIASVQIITLRIVSFITSLFIANLIISLFKFGWLMNQILKVRAAQARLSG